MTEIEFSTLDTPCAYLKGKNARSSYKYIYEASYAYNSALVEHGYRRFGKYFSKPICKDCNECKSLRIDAQKFKLTKSLRRVIRKNKDAGIEAVVTRPHLSQAHINLYEKYHKFMQNKRGWEYHQMNYERYFSVYVDGAGEFGFEVDDIPLMIEAIPLSGENIILQIKKVEYPEELDTRFSRFSEG